jgi:hypothetical protein
VTETAGAAHFVSSYGDDGYVCSTPTSRADGVLLDALIDQPRTISSRNWSGPAVGSQAGHWANTGGRLLCWRLDNYFNTYESITPTS